MTSRGNESSVNHYRAAIRSHPPGAQWMADLDAAQDGLGFRVCRHDGSCFQDLSQRAGSSPPKGYSMEKASPHENKPDEARPRQRQRHNQQFSKRKHRCR